MIQRRRFSRFSADIPHLCDARCNSPAGAAPAIEGAARPDASSRSSSDLGRRQSMTWNPGFQGRLGALAALSLAYGVQAHAQEMAPGAVVGTTYAQSKEAPR